MIGRGREACGLALKEQRQLGLAMGREGKVSPEEMDLHGCGLRAREEVMLGQ